MKIPFDKLSNDARIWIYPSNRKFSDEECLEIRGLCDDFLDKWTAHNNLLLASIDIPYNRFIVIGLETDFNLPTRCSIDSELKISQSNFPIQQNYN